MLTREKIVYYLESDDSSVAKWVNLIVPALVLLSSAIFIAETHPISPELKVFLNQINAIILLIFSLEYAIRFWCAENKIKFLFGFYSIIDLLVILPFFFKAFNFSFILIFRWFRILRLLRFIETQTFFGSIDREDGTILARILFTLFAIIFVYSGLIYQVEHPVNPEDFTTFFDAFYFSVVTMTTVGFGDVTPLSNWGRLMTVMMILTGVALIPWQVGDLIKQLIKTAHKVERQCGVCRLSFHDTDAKFCKHCGTELPHEEG